MAGWQAGRQTKRGRGRGDAGSSISFASVLFLLRGISFASSVRSTVLQVLKLSTIDNKIVVVIDIKSNQMLISISEEQLKA